MSPQAIPCEELKIEAEESVSGLSRFGRETAKHYFCKNCGIYAFHETAGAPGHCRVDPGCVDGVDLSSIAAGRPLLLRYGAVDSVGAIF